MRTAGFQIVKNFLRLPGTCSDVESLVALHTWLHGRRIVTRAPHCPGKTGREVRGRMHAAQQLQRGIAQRRVLFSPVLGRRWKHYGVYLVTLERQLKGGELSRSE